MPDENNLITEGLSPEQALIAFRSYCNRGPERLFITDSWFAPREAKLLALLSRPISFDEAHLLVEVAEKRVPLDVVVEWLETRTELTDTSWQRFAELKAARKTPRDLARVRQGFFPWEDVDASRERGVPTDMLRQLRAEGLSCPQCDRPASEMTWIAFESPTWTWEQMCGRAGWLSVCDACRLQIEFRLTTMN